MNYKLIIRPEAERDIKQSFEWYESKQNGLGRDFLVQIDASLMFIKQYPKFSPKKYKTIRMHITKRFPYKIIYSLKDNTINVLAVLHSRRKKQNF